MQRLNKDCSSSLFKQETLLILHEWMEIYKRKLMVTKQFDVVINLDNFSITFEFFTSNKIDNVEKYGYLRELMLDILEQYRFYNSGRLTQNDRKRIQAIIIDKIDLGNK